MRKPSIAVAEKIVAEGNIIGRGSQRRVYRMGRARFVIKVGQPNYFGNQNEREYRNYLRLIEMQKAGEISKNLCFPETFLLSNGMVAQQFVPGKHPPYCNTYSWSTTKLIKCQCPKRYPAWGGQCWIELARTATQDEHDKNVVISGGKVWVIDLGYDRF